MFIVHVMAQTDLGRAMARANSGYILPFPAVEFLALIIGGLLAAASLIIAKKPNAAELLKKLANYQTYIGIALLAIGVWRVFWFLINLGLSISWLSVLPVFTIGNIAAPFIILLVGLILSFNFMKTRKEIPVEKVEAMEKKLKPLQIPLGIAALADALLLLIAYIVKF